MKKNEVKVGGVYTAKVSDKVVPVRIDAVKGTGWSATNMATGKTIHIKSAQRLRGEAKGAAAKPAAPKAAKSPTAATGAKRPAKATTKAKPEKAATRAKQGEKGGKKPSGLDAAARVLAESAEPMGVKEIVKVAFAKGYWKSDGQTPHATIYSAMIREIATKGVEARFRKAERGKFAHA